MNDQQMLREIHTALVGNESLGHKGLVRRIEEAEHEVAGLKRFRDTLKAKVSVFAAMAGAAGAGVLEWFKKGNGSG